MRHKFTRLFALLLFVFPAQAQELNRYSFRREATVQTFDGSFTRKSLFTFSDSGKQIETEVSQTGNLTFITEEDWKRLRNPRIHAHPHASRTSDGDIWTNEFLRYTAWLTEDTTWSHVQGRPWFADKTAPSGLMFPVESEGEGRFKGKSIRLTIRYWDYRLFRTSVTIKEVAQVIRWPANSIVRVYFMSGFDETQKLAALRGVNSWRGVGNISFVREGDVSEAQECSSCLTLRRAKSINEHAGQLLSVYREDSGEITRAIIEVDPEVKGEKAIESLIAHETGHSFGLEDCNCKGIMGAYGSKVTLAGLSIGTRYTLPSEADIQKAREVYSKQ